MTYGPAQVPGPGVGNPWGKTCICHNHFSAVHVQSSHESTRIHPNKISLAIS